MGFKPKKEYDALPPERKLRLDEKIAEPQSPDMNSTTQTLAPRAAST